MRSLAGPSVKLQESFRNDLQPGTFNQVCTQGSRQDPKQGPSKPRGKPHEGFEASMISCQNIVDFCLDYLDGSLPVEDQSGFDRHLLVCGTCLSFFETYRRTSEISRQAL